MSSDNFFIFIDSRNKQYGSNSNFTMLMNDDYGASSANVSVSLDSMAFYNLQYPINSNNNTIIFQENNVLTDITITLTPGNYTLTEVAALIIAAMNTAGANTYTSSGDPNTGKLTIGGLVLPDVYRFVSINEIFGFELDTVFKLSRVAENPAVLAGFEYLDLLLPSLISLNVNTNPNINGMAKRVPLDLPWGSLISYQQQESDQSILINREYLNNLRVQLKNPDGTFYQLPDNTYLTITLKCKFII